MATGRKDPLNRGTSGHYQLATERRAALDFFHVLLNYCKLHILLNHLTRSMSLIVFVVQQSLTKYQIKNTELKLVLRVSLDINSKKIALMSRETQSNLGREI